MLTIGCNGLHAIKDQRAKGGISLNSNPYHTYTDQSLLTQLTKNNRCYQMLRLMIIIMYISNISAFRWWGLVGSCDNSRLSVNL